MDNTTSIIKQAIEESGIDRQQILLTFADYGTSGVFELGAKTVMDYLNENISADTVIHILGEYAKMHPEAKITVETPDGCTTAAISKANIYSDLLDNIVVDTK